MNSTRRHSLSWLGCFALHGTALSAMGVPVAMLAGELPSFSESGSQSQADLPHLKRKVMGKKRLAVEQIIQKPRQAELVPAHGQTVPQVVKKLGLTEPTYYRWRKEYDGLRADHS